MAAFSFATGLRASNVTGLQWPQVDLVRRLAWVHPDQAKARKAIPVPLNGEAVALVRSWSASIRRTCSAIEGRPITQVSSKPWYAALQRAGIEDFRWHDLRHTWASWHVQNGTPLFALQELGGWSAWRWCAVMPTLPPITWHLLRSVWVRCGPWNRKFTAQLRHSPQNERARIAASP